MKALCGVGTMAAKKTGSKQLGLKKASTKKAGTLIEVGGPPVLRLPLVGKIKRSDIRKAVLAVRDRKAHARVAVGES
jgi:hypothetical protein